MVWRTGLPIYLAIVNRYFIKMVKLSKGINSIVFDEPKQGVPSCLLLCGTLDRTCTSQKEVTA
jgi:hypothetical protein